jgi:hypothetical protein
MSVQASSLTPGDTVLVFLKLGLALEIRALPRGKFDRIVPSKPKVAEEWSWTKVLGLVTKYEDGFLYLEATLPTPKRLVPYNGPAFSTVIHYSAIKSAQLIHVVNNAPKEHPFQEGKHLRWDMSWLPYQTKEAIIFP